MLIANEPKFEDMRDLVDEEVTRYALTYETSRTEAYIAIANQLGYHIRAFSESEGWACVIAMPGYQWLCNLADRIAARREEEIEPLTNELECIAAKMDSSLAQLKKELSHNEIDSEDASRKLTKIENLESRRKSISTKIALKRKRMQSEFAREFCQELLGQIVIFGVSVETALIACVLRILDPQCDAFMSPEQIRASYTKQDLFKKGSVIRNLCLKDSSEPIPLLDEAVGDSRRILSLGVARMIRGFIKENIEDHTSSRFRN